MNANRVSAHYDALTPPERVALIVAAAARGDEVETERLSRTAQTKTYKIPDSFALWEAWRDLATAHLAECLDAAALFWRGQVLFNLLDGSDDCDAARRDRAERLWRLLAYNLVVRIDGWHQFGGETGVDVRWLWDAFPWSKTVYDAERQARAVALTAAEARAVLVAERIKAEDADGRTIEVTLRPVTPESVATEMRLCLKLQCERWE